MRSTAGAPVKMQAPLAGSAPRGLPDSPLRAAARRLQAALQRKPLQP